MMSLPAMDSTTPLDSTHPPGQHPAPLDSIRRQHPLPWQHPISDQQVGGTHPTGMLSCLS